MTLEYLRYFMAACDCGSIQSASKLLFVSAQGVGKGIQRLEQTLGVTLLERTQSGVRPTEVGQLYYEQAKVVEREIQRLEDIAREYSRDKKTRLSIGTLGHQKFFYGINACAEAFMKENPDAALEIVAEEFTSSDELFDCVRSGRIDVGWMFHWREHADLKYFCVSDYSQIMLLISAGHPLASRESVSWEDIASLRYVTAGENDPFSTLIKNLSITNGFTPNIAFYTTENNLIANIVDKGEAAILLRETYYRVVMRFCRNVRAVPLEPRLEIANSLFISKKRSFSSDTMAYIDYMVKYFRDVMGIGIKYS